ncbi:lactate utilization protein C [uncultured Photobacterium sp.]|uniref:LutC/YkgG family protein n=1 Tax=uncultured Photobacterium sp. TaxID=173973 RepID=UPI002638612F|nr:lactate utilization protein C [uncultured Photobacterium sp.]
MNPARTTILSRLREAGAHPLSSDDHCYHPWQSDSEQDIEQRFVEGLVASHAEVISTKAELLENVLNEVISSKQLNRIAIGSDGEFIQKIQQASQQNESIVFDRDITEWKNDLFGQVDAGITHCLAGIADTGTLILWPGTDEPRTLSLVPPTHIALIKRSTLISNFAELIQKQSWHIGMPTNAILVSGPSKTADIQQTLAYGAHGPKELIVILIEDK